MNKKKARKESPEATLAKVVKEMAQPRMTKSAREESAKLQGRAPVKPEPVAD